MHYIINTHYPTSTLSGSQHILSRFSHPPPPTRPPTSANADRLHTELFPTILGYEFISTTKENTYQIVFLSLIYFSFSCFADPAGLTAKRSLF